MSVKKISRLSDMSKEQLMNEVFKKNVNAVDIGHKGKKSNLVFRIDDKMILKLYEDDIRWKKETHNISRMKKSLFRTPRVINFGMIYKSYGWLAMTIVKGEVIGDSINRLPKRSQQNHAYNIGKMLADFHMKNKTNNKEQGFELFLHNKYYNNKFSIINQNYFGNKEMFCKAFKLSEEWLNRKKSKNKMYALCHNDFSLRNILYNQDKKTYGLIDFESSSYGQVESDLARCTIDLMPKGLENYFYNGYFHRNNSIYYNERDMRALMVLKLIGICSWANMYAVDYYKSSIKLMKEILK